MARVDKKISTTLLIRLKKSGGASAHPPPNPVWEKSEFRLKSLDFSAADAFGWL